MTSPAFPVLARRSDRVPPPGSWRRGRLAWIPAVTLTVLALPVLAGLAGTLLPAFGYLPALGGRSFALDPFCDLFAWPGLFQAARLSVTTGIAATAISLGLVAVICAGWAGSRVFALIERLLAPILSVPHAAAAFGLIFLIAPSGWLFRALSPWATGLVRPPDLLLVRDPAGLSLIAGLVAKEVPFLLLMTIAALGQIRATQSLEVARALGYRRVTGWLKTVFPLLYRQIRLPVYAVLAFSMSVVDVAMILGPDSPPTLAVQILRWMNDAELSLRFRAAAGAVLQLALVVGALGLWRLGEIGVARLGRSWIARGGRGGALDGFARLFGLGAAGIAAGSVIFGLLGLGLWSVAGFWGFPDLMPDQLTWQSWRRQGPWLLAPLGETFIIAASATLIALLLTLACLEVEYRRKPARAKVDQPRFAEARGLVVLYMPLLVPQIAFLLGLQMLAITLGFDGGRAGVVVGHLVFVLPYVFLALSDPFRAWEPRYGEVARALGAGPDAVFWRVRLPMLLRPVLTAAAIGMAVSVGQYLPTLLIGAGRVQTLTTEAVALASGGDRRVIGIYALAQTLAAFVTFAAAIAVPKLVWRHRRGLKQGLA